MITHKDLSAERWFKLTLLEQLANIGCDIERTIYWKKNGDIESSKKAFERALELLDLTKADPKNKGAALKELCRVKEALVDHFVYDNEYLTTDEIWQQYFYDFNYAVAIQKGR